MNTNDSSARSSCPAVIFDFFGVISSEVAPFWLAKYLPPEEALAVKADIVHRGDRGELTQDQMFAQLGRIVGVPAATALAEWRQLVRVDPEMVDLVRATRRCSRVGLLTNSAGPFVREVIAAHDLERLFDTIVVSSEVRMAKPQADIYRLTLDRLEVAAPWTTLVDDTLANIEGAATVGICGLLFTSPEQCRAELARKFQTIREPSLPQ